MKKSIVFLLLIFGLNTLNAQQSTRTVSRVTSEVKLTSAVDYIITDDSIPFSDGGSIDIIHDNAVVIFPNIKPSLVGRSWLGKVKVKGEKATRSSVWMSIYDNGCAIYPHPKENYTPLTVWELPNYAGASRSDFRPMDFYNNKSALGGFENNIRSFKLKRGYMLTLACNSDGTGYSRVFVAQDNDIEIAELQKELAGRIGFIRIFPWNRVSKKGCGAFDWNPGNILNVTWGYDWGAGASPFSEDVDYVGMHHHEDWPSYGEISTSRNFNTVLGNNEPDNTNDPSQNPIPAGQMEAVMFGDHGLTGAWRNIYKGGFRVGSPAMAGDYDFLRQFIDLCLKYNYRIDFIATHRYQMGSGWDYDWFVNWIWDQYHLPVWITEWNYGAEWNGNLDQGPIFFRDQIAGIVPILENNPHLERQAFFNVLGDANRMMTNRHEGMSIMPAGKWYKDYKSKTSYTGGEGYFMKWNYWKPEDLTATLNDRQKTVSLKWICLNGKQTDSTLIERKLPDENTWKVIARKGMDGAPYQTWQSDDLKNVSGLVSYRLRCYDSDGRVRTSNVADVTIGNAAGNETFQYGELTLTGTNEAISIDFNQPYDEAPSVFIGPITNNNIHTYVSPLFPRSSITANGFSYTAKPWTHQPNGTTTFTRTEEVPFLALPKGNYHFGNIDIEVGQLTLSDTVQVNFEQPFPDDVVPVVIACVTRSLQNTEPVLHKVWDITPRGFKCVVSFEAASGPLVLRQQLSYMAITPGQACIDADKHLFIAAGIGERPLYYNIPREETFTISDENGTDTLYLNDPLLFTELQTNNTPVAADLRLSAFSTTSRIEADGSHTYVTGVRLLRILDRSDNTVTQIDTPSTADNVGWVVLHVNDNYEETTDDIRTVKGPSSQGASLRGSIYDLAGRSIAGTQLRKGFYIVNGRKVFVK